MQKSLSKYLNLDTTIAVVMFCAILLFVITMNTDRAEITRRTLFLLTALGSLPLLYEIVHAIFRRKFGVDLIAATAIIAALALNEVLAAALVLLMLSGGEALEHFAQDRARNSLEKLLRRTPTSAHKILESGIEDVLIDQVKIGDVILIKQNEVFPIDGIIVQGKSSVDESAITGEPMPRTVFPGDKVWSGTINTDSALRVEATTTYDKSIFAGIIHLISDAEKNKAPTVRMADRYSVVFTVFTFVIAGVATIVRPELGVAVLVVATPCPLILAAPIAFIAGMSKSARKGVIVKHGGVFEALVKVKAYFFDKTGTLTYGSPIVENIESLDQNFSRDEILSIAASIEQFSTHILAESIFNKAKENKIVLKETGDATETVGDGVSGIIGGVTYSVGKKDAMILDNSTVYVLKENIPIGKIHFSDHIRANTKEVLQKLRSISPNTEIALVTGDNNSRAQAVAKELGFSVVKSDCLPEGKVELVNEYEEKNIPVAMIGDGVNDSPALARASVGIALGYRGATAATDAADAVITVNDVSKIIDLVETSHKTIYIAKQSIFIGIGLSMVAMVFAFLGYLPPAYGALLQEVIDVLVILNALRALN